MGQEVEVGHLESKLHLYRAGLTLDQIDLHLALRPFERELNQVKLGSIGNRLTDQRS